jgi:hypothetical protein
MVNESERARRRIAASRAVSDVADRKGYHANCDLGERRIVLAPSPDDIVSGRFSAFRNTEQIRNRIGRVLALRWWPLSDVENSSPKVICGPALCYSSVNTPAIARCCWSGIRWR